MVCSGERPCHHEPRRFGLCIPAQCGVGIRPTVERRVNSRGALAETDCHRFLLGIPCNELHGVHAAALAEPIDAPDALLQAKRGPRQLEVDYEATAVMKIEA